MIPLSCLGTTEVASICVDQSVYWERQHHSRALEHRNIEGIPNAFAVRCAMHLRPFSKVVEIGPGNGRDTRYFARQKQCSILAVDIAQAAIAQLKDAAVRDGTHNQITTLVSSAQELTKEKIGKVDAFYARSALHLSESEWDTFLSLVTNCLNPRGFIMIEGKSHADPKIKRSTSIAENLFCDIDGHVRRAWSEEGIRAFIARIGYSLININHSVEKWNEADTHFISCIAQKG
jgi:cyclopropane fatty-acyl-phospholipid synthase-like methyltransferase